MCRDLAVIGGGINCIYGVLVELTVSNHNEAALAAFFMLVHFSVDGYSYLTMRHHEHRWNHHGYFQATGY